MTNQRPPELNKQKKKKNNRIIQNCIVCVLAGGFAFGGTCLGNMLTGNKTQENTNAPSYSSSSKQTATSYTGQINDVSDVAAKCKPSIVEIRTESVTSGNSMFGNYVSQGAGSGVIWTDNGYIVTNNHVIDGASTVSVTTADGQEFPAEIVGADSQTDLAVIKIDATELPVVDIGDSDALEVGDPAIAIGNPLGELGGTVTSGIISALDREITINNETMTLLQTDAAINPGNSGGGLFDGSGKLIGVVNAKTSSEGIEGLGFAIPISGAIDIIDQLMTNGKVTGRPGLNVSLYDYVESGYGFSMNQARYENGVYIVQIVNNGAADKAGLQKMDRIISFDGNEITSSSQVKAILRKHKIGDKVEIVINRNGEEIRTTVTLQELNTTVYEDE
ncbi:MAG: trypsin-like peptidase domain-containing protein [Bacillota bacterium]|nr:trypsin-like peptidase domain-containing protein [Bacillota bacterium]